MDLAFRTQNACAQLTRYGGRVASAELAAVLESLTDINDDMQHGRDIRLLRAKVEKAKALLDLVAVNAGTKDNR
jgi:hypothetical protein